MITIGIKIYDFVTKPIIYLSQKISLLNDLETENIKLKLELAELRQLHDSNAATKVENEYLKKTLNIIPDQKPNYIKARLLSVSLNPFSKTILVGAGEKHGVTVDQIVSIQEGLVGRVIQTNKNYSKIMLINDLNSRIPVISAITGERAILSGEGNTLNLLYLSEHHKIQEGEIMLTSGDGKMYPYGIPVGKVININKNQVNIQPAVNLNNVNFVNILVLSQE